jgi:SAM-dependent methyltransferase
MRPPDSPSLIAWKTDAWKDPAFVEHYERRMADLRSGVQVKNRVETDLCARFAAGEEILDVGIGTGRASLPLAQAGKRVTGVDSSQAMLDMTRANAGAVPVRLLLGDVAKLPFTNERFDTVLALNTIAHFPHWRAILAEWRRFVRPGGRIVFDIFSLDHHHAVGAAAGMDRAAAAAAFGPQGISDYYTRITADDLVNAATDLDLCIVDVAPYAAFFGLTGSNDWLRGSLAFDRSWDRLVSWCNVLPELFELLVLLEEALLWQLGSEASGRMMVALENRSDLEANDAWRERNRRKNAALRPGLDAAALAACGVDVAALRAALAGLMRFRPNRVALFRLLTATLGRPWTIRLDELLDADALAGVGAMLERERIDRGVGAALAAFAEAARPLLTYHGIDLADALKYELTEAILDAGLGVYDARREAAP